MRALLGIALSFVACSSSEQVKPGPEPTMQPVVEPPTPLYPSGVCPTGTGNGGVVDEVANDFEWDAFLPGAPPGKTSKIALHDFYDPSGARGINALLIVSCAEWCGACQSEAQMLEGKIRSTWGAQGVSVLDLVIEDTMRDRSIPNVTVAADRWRTKFDFRIVAVGIDPGFHFASSGTNGLPLNIVIDPRTMTTSARIDGSGGAVDLAIATLVAKNRIP